MDGKIIMVPDFSGKYVEIDEADMDKYPVDVVKIYERFVVGDIIERQGEKAIIICAKGRLFLVGRRWYSAEELIRKGWFRINKVYVPGNDIV